MTKKIEKNLQAIIKSATEALEELKGAAVEETEDNGIDLDSLADMDVKELKKIAKDAGIEGADKIKKKDDLIEAITEFYAGDEDEESEDEDEESEGYSEEDLEAMSDKELTAVCEELEVEPVKKGKKLDKAATIEAILEAQDGEEEDEDGEEDEESDEDETPTYTEKELKKMDEAELTELCEAHEIEPVTSGKGKAKKFDKAATIAAILEAQEAEEEDEDGDEDESEEEGLETYEEDDLDELDEKELKAHLQELADNAEDYGFDMPKGWEKLKGAAKLKKAVLEVYAQLEDE